MDYTTRYNLIENSIEMSQTIFKNFNSSQLLLCNFLAQTEALMKGKAVEQVNFTKEMFHHFLHLLVCSQQKFYSVGGGRTKENWEV